MVLKDEGVSGGVRSAGGRRAKSGPSLLMGEAEGDEARSSGLRWGRCLAVPLSGRPEESEPY